MASLLPWAEDTEGGGVVNGGRDIVLGIAAVGCGGVDGCGPALHPGRNCAEARGKEVRVASQLAAVPHRVRGGSGRSDSHGCWQGRAL